MRFYGRRPANAAAKCPFSVPERVLRREKGISPKDARAGERRLHPTIGTDSDGKEGKAKAGLRQRRLDALDGGPCLLHRPDGVPGGVEEEATCHISTDIYSMAINSRHDSPDRRR